jgi:hypothetical protein
VVQGAGAALVVPSSLALLNGTLRRADRAHGIAIWAGSATIGATIRPVCGRVVGRSRLVARCVSAQRSVDRGRPVDAADCFRRSRRTDDRTHST